MRRAGATINGAFSPAKFNKKSFDNLYIYAEKSVRIEE